MGRDFLQNLRAGLRLATFRPVSAYAFRATVDQLAALALFTIVLDLACSYFYTEPPREFFAGGLHGSLAALGFECALFYLLARWAGTPERTRGALVASFAGGATYAPVHLALYRGLQASGLADDGLIAYLVAWATYAWQGCIAFYAARIFLPLGALRAAPAIALVFLAVWALELLAPLPRFWFTGWEAPDVAEERSAAPDFERILYDQPALLAGVRDHLAKQRPGVVDLYFVAFAADATQEVFLREVRYARELFEERFDAEGRSVVLANHESTATILPLATKTNLRETLAAVASRMDRDEDVLFLFLTGHGSREHELAVRFPPQPLNAIDPPALAEMVDAAGIANRVVVVSACYSGGFVDALKADTAIVATASAADKRSFGCSNEAHFTYYGEALFAEALRGSLSFPEAMEAARTAVSEREKKEDKEPSLPQLFVGDAIRARLGPLEKRLAALAAEAGGKRLEALADPPVPDEGWPTPADEEAGNAVPGSPAP